MPRGTMALLLSNFSGRGHCFDIGKAVDFDYSCGTKGGRPVEVRQQDAPVRSRHDCVRHRREWSLRLAMKAYSSRLS